MMLENNPSMRCYLSESGVEERYCMGRKKYMTSKDPDVELRMEVVV